MRSRGAAAFSTITARSANVVCLASSIGYRFLEI
jgi:hypothetical protein